MGHSWWKSTWQSRFNRLRKPIRYAIDRFVSEQLEANYKRWYEMPKLGFVSTFEYEEKSRKRRKAG